MEWKESFTNYAVELARLYKDYPENITACLRFSSVVGSLNETYQVLVRQNALTPIENLPKEEKIKSWIALNLKYWCMVNGFELQEEVRFHPERKWRFDWAIVIQSESGELKIAIEYNGIMSQKSRHTTVTGYSGDMEKINAAQALGWKVFQYTPITYKQLLTDLNRLI